ncbi:MAG: four helix bundle protein [Opitutales bacterium]|nr:four helix bundle protein [Opitutales bacterium]
MGKNNRNGSDYGSNKQFIHFLKITKGSASEVPAQLVPASDIGYALKRKQLVFKEKLKKFSSLARNL